MTKITLNLPFPVSVNAIWRGKHKGAYKSPKYKAWITQAGLEWMTQKVKQPKQIPGEFSAFIILARPDKRVRDIDNFAKGIMDFCKAHNLIVDDKLCSRLYIRWGKPHEAPLGSKVILKNHS